MFGGENLSDCGAIIVTDSVQVNNVNETVPVFAMSSPHWDIVSQGYADSPIEITLTYECDFPI